MSVILDVLKKMDETRAGTLEENNAQAFYKKRPHSFIDYYKYWIIAGAFIVLIMLTGALFFLHQKIASLPTAPVAVLNGEEKKRIAAPEPVKLLESSEAQKALSPEPKAVQPTVPHSEPTITSNKDESEPDDPDVNQEASEQVQAAIQNDPSVPVSAAKNEEANVERNGITADTSLTTGVDNSIQFAESGPSDEALKELKDNLAASMSRQSYAQIIEDANAALGTYPKDVDLHYYLGLAYFNLNRYSEALNILTRLQPPMNHYPDYYAVLANVYMHQEALDNALYVYESLVALYPDNGSYALGLGIIYQKQGKFAAAKAIYQHILSFEPVYWSAYPFVQAQLKTLSSVKE